MRKVKVTQERLPGIGTLFELRTACGLAVSVAYHPSGRRHVSLTEPGADEPLATVALSRTEALAVAALLTGTNIELTTMPKS
jgi:K+/H+ antiporter YhaU regulatory subunit KhtT